MSRTRATLIAVCAGMVAGGVVCVVVALIAPTTPWLGYLAGAGVGVHIGRVTWRDLERKAGRP